MNVKTNNPIYKHSLSTVCSVIGMMLLLGIIVWFYISNNTKVTSSEQLELFDKRQLLLKNEARLYGKWLHTLNPLVSKTEGDIVWDNATQRGVLLFVGLPPTTSGQHYQLHIYDLERKNSSSVVGATFTKSSQKREQFLVPIMPDNPVILPYKFTLSIVDEETDDRQLLLLAQP